MAPRRKAAASFRGPALLKSSQAKVLREVNALTDAVLEHILADTASLLDRLPCAAPPASETPLAEDAERILRTTIGFGLLDKPLPVDELASQAARTALGELQQLEHTLEWRYTPACSMGATRIQSLQDDATVHITSSSPPLRTRTCWLPHPEPLDWVEGFPKKMWPAALPLERVQNLEHYRTRFAHHCLASREAGIDRSGPGDAASTATWVIWPYLADSIALAAVEGAVEECHAAMEQHVDELVSRELGACPRGV